jgi:ABC-type glycerol-3-phosphate transport system substrate-binding protein
MKDLNIFQMVFLGVFVLFVIGGILIFALQKGGGGLTNVSETIVWGTISPGEVLSGPSNIFQNDKTVRITYVQKDAGTFDGDLVEAIANGTGPDLVILPQDSLLRNLNKILPIPYATYPVRTLKDTFAQEGELYLGTDGVLALPLTIDPLVMYWNRDFFNTAGLVKPPVNWEEFLSLAGTLSVKDTNNNITRSAMALGDFSNISNAKEILLALFFQAEVPIAKVSSGSVKTDQDANTSGASVLNFYTQFANPLGAAYSWNHSLPLSIDYFIANNLAIYFGFASEINAIRAKNPNLNFDVTTFPQLKSSGTSVTFGRMNGVSVLKSSRNPNQSILVATKLSASQADLALSAALGLPPARRDLLAIKPVDPYQSLFYTAALQSHAWLDPSKSETSLIFKTMVESVVSGVLAPSSAFGEASQQIQKLIK